MTASAPTSSSARATNVLLIPVDAGVRTTRARSSPTSSAATGIETRPVDLGESNDRMVEVVGGLREGERVSLTAPGTGRRRPAARQPDLRSAAMRFSLAELGEFLRIAAEALGRYQLRTALSVLGVVLGVAAVIAMMSVSEGAAREALAQVDALGLDNLVARSTGGLERRRARCSEPDRRAMRTRAGARAAGELASPLVSRYVRVGRGRHGQHAQCSACRPSFSASCG